MQSLFLWGVGAPCLHILPKSTGVVGAEGLWLTGFPLGPVRPSPRPHVLGLAWATGPARPQPPWRLSSGSAPRWLWSQVQGFPPRVGWGAEAMSASAIPGVPGAFVRVSVTWRPVTSDLRPSFPLPRTLPISGAGSGIGRAISVRLAKEGAVVAACDLDRAAAQDTVQLLGGSGSEAGAPRGKHAAFQADVSQAPAARRLLEQVQVNQSPRPTALGRALYGLWCQPPPPSHRPAFLARHLSLCPVRASHAISFCSTCRKKTGTEL